MPYKIAQLAHLFLSMVGVIVVAAPTENLDSRNSCKAFTDTFEEFGAVVAPQATPVGQYHGVTYQAWAVASKGAVSGTVGGVIPHSANNAAVASVNDALVQIGAVTLNGFGNIIATPSKSFDLYSFWFGCGQNNANPALPGVPEGCTIGVTGYTADNKVVPLASYNYAPRSSSTATMQLAALPSYFRNLKNVTFGVATGSLVTATTLLIVDDVSHCNY